VSVAMISILERLVIVFVLAMIFVGVALVMLGA
jgi:hypothetical protein